MPLGGSALFLVVFVHLTLVVRPKSSPSGFATFVFTCQFRDLVCDIIVAGIFIVVGLTLGVRSSLS